LHGRSFWAFKWFCVAALENLSDFA
jgi:hypothetical protein